MKTTTKALSLLIAAAICTSAYATFGSVYGCHWPGVNKKGKVVCKKSLSGPGVVKYIVIPEYNSVLGLLRAEVVNQSCKKFHSTDLGEMSHFPEDAIWKSVHDYYRSMDRRICIDDIYPHSAFYKVNRKGKTSGGVLGSYEECDWCED